MNTFGYDLWGYMTTDQNLAYMYFSVRHFFSIFEHRPHKILIQRAFYSPRLGDSKSLFIFFLRRIISRIIWFQSFGSPVLKFEIYIFFKYNHVTYQKMRIGTLNLNIESIWKNVGKCSIGMRKTVFFFGKFPNFTSFLPPVQSILKIFEKWFNICVHCPDARLLNLQKDIFKKIFFKLYYRGSQNLKSEKIKTVLKTPDQGL